MAQVSVLVILTNAREFVTSRLGGLLPEAVHTCDVEALIDTEHTPSVMPKWLARRLSLAWERRETWRPDGRWGEAEVTELVQVEVFGRTATIEALVMGKQVSLGATVLTSTDLRWDATRGAFRPYLGTWEQPVFRV